MQHENRISEFGVRSLEKHQRAVQTMLMPDSYIVRIYRRNKKNPRLIAGIVEQVGDAGWKAGFENAEEMQRILTGKERAVKKDGNDGS